MIVRIKSPSLISRTKRVLYAGFCKISDSLWKIYNPEPSDCFRTYCTKPVVFFSANNPSYIRSLRRHFITGFSKIFEVRYIYPNPRCWKHGCFMYIFQYSFCFSQKKIPSYIRSLRRGLMHMIFNFFQSNKKNSFKSSYFGLKLFFDVKIVYNMVKLSKSTWIPSPHFLVLYWWYPPVLFESLRQRV